MIEVLNLTKKYGQIKAVDDISFKVEQGEIVGFLGLNGAGKSTTMNILTGYISSTSGVCKINGFDVLENPKEAKASIGYLPEQPPLYIDMTVEEYLYFVYDLKKIKMGKKKHIKEICDIVKIDHVLNRSIKNLSKGYKQRVGIAQALLGKPKVLILDEPTAGLDPQQIVEIRNLIRELGAEYTVILSSHILSEIQAVCDRVIVLHGGKLVADDTSSNLTEKMTSDNLYTMLIEGNESNVIDVIKNVNSVISVQADGMKHENIYQYIAEFDNSDENRTTIDVRRDIFNALVENNMVLLGLKTAELTLEQAFLQLTDNNVKLSPTKDPNETYNEVENIETPYEEAEIIEKPYEELEIIQENNEKGEN